MMSRTQRVVGRNLFSANGRSATRSVIREVTAGSFVPLRPINTQLSGRTMALDPVTGRVFIVAAQTTATALRAFFKA